MEEIESSQKLNKDFELLYDPDGDSLYVTVKHEGSLIVVVIPKPPIGVETFEDDDVDYDLKFKLPTSTSLWKKKISGETLGDVSVVADMHEREDAMANEVEALSALPGGFGTMEELLEMITWSQLGIHNKKQRRNQER